MNNRFFIYNLLIFSLFLTTACSSDDDGSTDNESPEILVLSPEEGQEFEPGETINVSIDFYDNVALASYKIDIHYAGDDHSHRPVLKHDHLEEWSHEVIGSLSGTSETINLTIEIPTEIVEGDYHFGVIALDESGNQGEDFTDIEIGDHHDDDHDDDHNHDDDHDHRS